MSPFSVCPPGGGLPSVSLYEGPPSQRCLLAVEEWYHGPISRWDIARPFRRSHGRVLLSHKEPAKRKKCP